MKYANVTNACKIAKISRLCAYDWRKADEDFAAAWEEALAIGFEALEDEMHRRATKGTLKPVFHQGEKCGSIRQYSNTLAIFLAKAHKPEKYRERSEIKHSGIKGGVMLIPAGSNPEDWTAEAEGVRESQDEHRNGNGNG